MKLSIAIKQDLKQTELILKFEILNLMANINYFIDTLANLMKPQTKSVPLLHQPASGSVLA